MSAAVTRPPAKPVELERLLIAASLSQRVEVCPVREDGTSGTATPSSARTLALRVRAGKPHGVSHSDQPDDDGLYQWVVFLKRGAVRVTRYVAWVQASPAEIEAIRLRRQEAKEFRERLAHSQRKKKPWGPL